MNDLAHITDQPMSVAGQTLRHTDADASAVFYIKPTTRANSDAAIRIISDQGWCIDAKVAPGHARVVLVRYSRADTDLQGIWRNLRELDINVALISC